jgi:FtsP/CotA-like multicopper oxidase with cupredoxin domain
MGVSRRTGRWVVDMGLCHKLEHEDMGMMSAFKVV